MHLEPNNGQICSPVYLTFKTQVENEDWWNIWKILLPKYHTKSFLWDFYDHLPYFNDAAVCVYISLLDRGLAELPESKMKEWETALPDKHIF